MIPTPAVAPQKITNTFDSVKGRFMAIMRFFIAVLLVTTALLANGDAISETTHSNTRSDSLSLARSKNSWKYEARFLSVDDTTDSEVRVLPIPPPSFALFTKWIKSLGLKITNKVRARYWLWRKQSAEDVFKQLKLDRGLNNILDNPKIKTWATYIDLYNKKNQKNPDKQVIMAEILIKTYGDLPVATMLQRTRSAPKLARRLRVEQNILWKRSKKSADDVFVLLQLNKVGDDMFVSPQLNSWYNYVTWLEKEKANGVMASVLSTHYSDETLQKMFREAKPRFKRMRFVTLWLENAVEMNRPVSALSPEEYFIRLKLYTGVDKLLTNPNLIPWITFLAEYNAKNPGKGTTMIKIFTKFYGDRQVAVMFEAAKKVQKTKKTATLFQRGQFQQWLRDNKDPDMIKIILKIEKETDPIWRQYGEFYSKYRKQR
ncbi:Avirulence protein (Avh) [Phytophthora palmivora]|uniref:RxLR effector protein n=1 Tax=Phytophthora palmivora TaxID=4796 RepID=A0A2P4Y1I1_9STRA|nr:Avirulence protein (Avh) [Phytophthora palmivora]